MGIGRDVFQSGRASDCTSWWLHTCWCCSAATASPACGPTPASCSGRSPGAQTSARDEDATALTRRRLPAACDQCPAAQAPGFLGASAADAAPLRCRPPFQPKGRASPQPQCRWPQECLGCLCGHHRPSQPVSAIHSESTQTCAHQGAAGGETRPTVHPSVGSPPGTIELAWLAPSRRLGTRVDVTTQGPPGREWVEARDAAPHPAVPRMPT